MNALVRQTLDFELESARMFLQEHLRDLERAEEGLDWARKRVEETKARIAAFEEALAEDAVVA